MWKAAIDSKHPVSEDGTATLRAELIGQLSAAQIEIETVIADLTRDGTASPVLLEARSQLGALIALRRKMASASPSALTDLRSEVAAMVATSQAAAQQARTAAVNVIDPAELANRAQEARAKVDEIMRGMKDFDPYLRFANARDEEEYRKREEERRAYIATEQAKGTVEGARNSVDAAIEQLQDAKTHGADNSPLFEQRMASLTQIKGSLKEAAAMTSLPSAQNGTNPPQLSEGTNLDAAMAALKGAGVSVVADSTEIAASSPVPDARSRAATSGRA